MKALIIFSNCSFLLSAVAGSIITGRLPEQFTAAAVKSVMSEAVNYREGQIHILGKNPSGTFIAACTARSGKQILKNLLTTFLKVNRVEESSYRLLEVNTPPSLKLLLGQFLLCLSPESGPGRSMLEKYIENVYPLLVNAVKLDWNCQISDN